MDDLRFANNVATEFRLLLGRAWRQASRNKVLIIVTLAQTWCACLGGAPWLHRVLGGALLGRDGGRADTRTCCSAAAPPLACLLARRPASPRPPPPAPRPPGSLASIIGLMLAWLYSDMDPSRTGSIQDETGGRQGAGLVVPPGASCRRPAAPVPLTAGWLAGWHPCRRASWEPTRPMLLRTPPRRHPLLLHHLHGCGPRAAGCSLPAAAGKGAGRRSPALPASRAAADRCRRPRPPLPVCAAMGAMFGALTAFGMVRGARGGAVAGWAGHAEGLCCAGLGCAVLCWAGLCCAGRGRARRPTREPCSSSPSLPTAQERGIVNRERASKAYHVSPYYLAR